MRVIRKIWRSAFLCVITVLLLFSMTAFAEEVEGEDSDVHEYKMTLEIAEDDYVYNGETHTPNVVVAQYDADGKMIEGSKLEEGIDYTIAYSDNLNAGEAKVEVTGMGEYSNLYFLEYFEIKKATLSEATVSTGTSYTYNGKKQEPTVTVKINGTKLKNNQDYYLEFSNNVEVGTAEVTAIGQGNYEGKSSTTFKIELGKPSFTLKRSYNSIKLNLKEVTGASGYIIFRSTQKQSGYKQIGRVKSGTALSYTDKYLWHNKTYYYKVRVYRMVDGKPKYSGYSNVGYCTTRVLSPTIQKLGKVNHNTLEIKWDSVAGATGYRVYRSTSKDGTYKIVATLDNKNTLTYKDKGLVCGRTYYYKVRAYRTVSGTKYFGSYSEIKKNNTRPTKVTMSSETAYDSTKTYLKWKKSNGAEGYEIYRATSKNGTYKKVKTITSGNTLEWTHTGLTKGKNYYYKIRAYCKTDGNTVNGLYSEILDRSTISWKYTTSDGRKVKLYYNDKGELVKNVDKIIGKQDSYVIRVNKQRATVTVYAKDGKNGYIIPVKAFVCSPGKTTPVGTFYTPIKYRWKELMGPCWGQWSTRIVGGVLFHSVYYNSYNNSNALSVNAYNKLGTVCSHGCVRLTAGDAKWIYDNCELQTKVIIYNSSISGPFGKPSAVQLPYWHTWDPTDPNKFKKCDSYGCH